MVANEGVGGLYRGICDTSVTTAYSLYMNEGVGGLYRGICDTSVTTAYSLYIYTDIQIDR